MFEKICCKKHYQTAVEVIEFILEDKFFYSRFRFSIMQRQLLYLLFIVSTFWSFVIISPIRLTINVGGSEIRETDILIMLVVIYWIFFLSKKENNSSKNLYFPLNILIVILIIPIFIAIIDGKNYLLILRDVRTPLYYFVMIPMASFFRDHDNINKFLKIIIITGFIGASIGILRWLIIGGTDEFGRTRFAFGGASSAVWLCFISFAYLIFQKKSVKYFSLALFSLILCLVYIFIANDARSTYLGTFAGLFVLFIYRKQIKKHNIIVSRSHSHSKYIFIVLLLLFTGLTVNYFMLSNESVLLELSKNNNVIRRIYSLYNPKVDEMGFGNREDRMLALDYAYILGSLNFGFGYGYGDNNFVNLDDMTIERLVSGNKIGDDPGNVIEGLLFFHNSYAWALARLGLWLSILYFITILYLIFNAHKILNESKNQSDRIIISSSIAFAIYTLVSGFGGGGFFDYMGTGMVPWLFCLALLTRYSVFERTT